MESPRISIIIRCYNEAEYIGQLLHGIEQQSIRDYEIILVDSGSTDGTLEIAESFDVDTVHIDRENFSFGRALSHGCKAVSGTFCVIPSAHVYPKRDDWLEQLLAKFDDNVALVYGKQLGNEVTTFSENQIFKSGFPTTILTVRTILSVTMRTRRFAGTSGKNFPTTSNSLGWRTSTGQSVSRRQATTSRIRRTPKLFTFTTRRSKRYSTATAKHMPTSKSCQISRFPFSTPPGSP